MSVGWSHILTFDLTCITQVDILRDLWYTILVTDLEERRLPWCPTTPLRYRYYCKTERNQPPRIHQSRFDFWIALPLILHALREEFEVNSPHQASFNRYVGSDKRKDKAAEKLDCGWACRLLFYECGRRKKLAKSLFDEVPPDQVGSSLKEQEQSSWRLWHRCREA